MKILFVVNPVSGATSNDKAILFIHEKARETRTDFKFCYTTGENDEDVILTQLKDYEPDRVVACGGDGTVQLVARVLMGKNVPIAILPLGSANGLATALGLPQGLEDAVTLSMTGKKVKPLDILRFDNKHYCTHLADIGINARMVKRYTEEGGSGMIGYAKHLVQSIKESPLLKYTIKTPERTYHKEGYMMAFANAHMYGTGIHISQGSVSDGKFEICNVERVALDDAIKAGLTKFNVFIDKNMFSDVISCAKAEITIDQKTDFQIDGEYMGQIDHLHIDILPSYLHIVTQEDNRE
ncbi:diacylglycerol/lipid kinase family protein [Ohtaekwangia koreensis]|uniref:Diacylglycerol kinase family enzyme n=1 Tax=Ohtaekwangia koreensis TaxID=688867 RepID=A0A1T5IJ13_9BACT|nr:diacylglycerol kinase family protein [Ohtaekwangia koreensis]SKC39090.1 Diacylglycerol kinase family enzyme [Ohtaekwangia koreensis]